MRRDAWLGASIGIAIQLAACASGTIAEAPLALPEHIVMMNKLGELVGEDVSPTECNVAGTANLDYRKPLCQDAQSPEECDQAIRTRMREQVGHIIKCTPVKGGKRRIVIFVHGGLNKPDEELLRAKNLRGVITRAGAYPIFINWNSSLWSSYFDHLLFVRQGRYSRAQWLFAPAYFVNDIARAVGRSALTLGQLVKSDYEGSVLCPGRVGCRENAEIVADRLRAYRVSSVDMRSSTIPNSASVASGISWFTTLPIQWLTGPIIDSTGSAAWEIMWRRTTNLFYRDEDFNVVNGPRPQKARGGMAYFLDALAEGLADEKPDQWEIVLVGHSMGAIVVNEIVRGWGPRLPISDIVYMAAACTVRDYEDSVWPFLEHARTTPGTLVPRVHHLMLHPKAEAQDLGLGWGLLYPFPRGSLLVWIDGLFTNPPTPLDLVAGRFTDIMRTIESTPGDLREFIDYRVFQHRRNHDHENQPQAHSDFGELIKFWESECWGNDLEPDQWETRCWCTEGCETLAGVLPSPPKRTATQK